MTPRTSDQIVRIDVGGAWIQGALAVPSTLYGVVLFAHGSGSSRHSPRSLFVADALQRAGFGTVLLDLLTAAEDVMPDARFDIDLLTERLALATRWARGEPATRDVPLGYFGASTGAAAALQAALEVGPDVAAIVSRGGRPDLARDLERVTTPTLLIVGGDDAGVLELNRAAYRQLAGEKELAIVPGATHLFEEPGALDEVARQATRWFARHLADLDLRDEGTRGLAVL